ncbi:MAG: DUF3842 family protein [Treponema sp.]|nr:DUF3842 family protein [Treponema sp.]
MKKTIVIIDGMGGGIGAALAAKIRPLDGLEGPEGKTELEIIALGTNGVAAERMVKAGAHRGASGENAVKVSAGLGDFILGPIGIVIMNSLMGELSPVMAEAILKAPGERILLPLENDHFYLAGLEPLSLAKMIDRAVDYLRVRLTGAPPPIAKR